MNLRQRLDKIRQLEQKATPGEWRFKQYDRIRYSLMGGHRYVMGRTLFLRLRCQMTPPSSPPCATNSPALPRKPAAPWMPCAASGARFPSAKVKRSGGAR